MTHKRRNAKDGGNGGGGPAIKLRIKDKVRTPKGLICISDGGKGGGESNGGNKYYTASYGTAETAPPKTRNTKCARPRERPTTPLQPTARMAVYTEDASGDNADERT